MDIAEKLIAEYARKIYGFAWSKTHHYQDAQDLSQNILLTLCKIDFASKDISDMDGYVYRVCQYTWSNFVRKSKPVWEGIGYNDEMDNTASNENVEGEIIRDELYQKLRREIMYLGKAKREITILFYYENKSGKEISSLLGIPASTVRWHLHESKIILKERIEMTNTIYTPKKLTVYFCGNANDGHLSGLRDDLLVQNICIVCGKKALTVEEISNTLCISAAFIENKLDALVTMNYLEKTGGNKYRTTFLIKDADFFIAQKKFELENIPPVAKAIGIAVKECLPKIREIGFIGCDFDENFLMWAFVTIVAHEYLNKNALPLTVKPPIRGDGSEHWIDASWNSEEIFKCCETLDADLKEYIEYSGGAAGKLMSNGKIAIQQFDPVIAGERADFFNAPMQSDLMRVYKIIKESIEPNEHDKEIISQLTAQGYVTVSDGKPKIMIPYFTKEEYRKFRKIIDEIILPSVEEQAGTDIAERYAKYITKIIPPYLSDEEKEFIKTRFYEPNAFSWLLLKEGLLAKPSKDEKKRICTVAWEN